MTHDEFSEGLEFQMSGHKWRCTDVGRRVIVAIKLNLLDDHPSWYTGPPYAVSEMVLDEDDLPLCERL